MKRTAALFKALADSTRIRILALVIAEGKLCVCDIMAALNLPQSTVSRHLAHLRNTGWLDDHREGIWVYYSLRETDDPIQSMLLRLFRERICDDPVVADDRRRLGEFAQRGKCA